MMEIVRPMASYDWPAIRDVYRRAHPGWPDKPREWWLANPTLVYTVPGADGRRVVGHTSLMVDTLQRIAHYRDVCVDPDFAGRGVGRLLVMERETFARDAGATMFIGCTWDENEAMVRIFEKLGYHRCQRVPGAFKHNDPPRDGTLWIKSDLL